MSTSPKPRRGKPFQPGQSGNPQGKRRGTRNKLTCAAEALLEGEAEALTRKAIEKAKDGDNTALRLCLDRIIPAKRDRAISFPLSPIATAADASAAMTAILGAVAAGQITPSEGGDVARLIESFVKAHEVSTIEQRLSALEARSGK